MKESWKFSEIWNTSLENRVDRPVAPRENLWASELGKPYSEVFLKLRGTIPTNPPDGRSKRKFEAGNLWEWLVRLILIRASIMRSHQDRAEYQYEGLLQVTGKIDFIAGGMPSWEEAEKALEGLMLPEAFANAAKNIVETLKEKYPEGLSEKVLEIKSVSAFMFDGLETRKATLKIHRLQCYHYLKSKNLPEGEVVYICRDDCRMIQIPVLLNDPAVEKEYRDWIEGMSAIHKAGEMPAIEQCIVFDEDLGKFSKNNQVCWSPFLTMLYGFQNQGEFDDKYAPVATRWNRVLGRVKRGDKMTDKNLDVLREIEGAGFNAEEIVAKFSPEAEEELPA